MGTAGEELAEDQHLEKAARWYRWPLSLTLSLPRRSDERPLPLPRATRHHTLFIITCACACAANHIKVVRPKLDRPYRRRWPCISCTQDSLVQVKILKRPAGETTSTEKSSVEPEYKSLAQREAEYATARYAP